MPLSRTRKGGGIRVADIGELIAPYLDVMSRDYVMVDIAVPWLFSSLLLGDVVDFASAYVPNGAGTRGVDAKAFVVGREMNLDPSRPGQVKLTLYLPRSPVVGYTPSALIDSQVNTSGTTWTLTIDDADALNIAWSEGVDGDVVKHFAAAQRIRVVELGTTAATEVAGTVVSVSGTTQIIVTLDASWTPGAGEWALMWLADAGTLDATQEAWAYMADDSRQLYDGSNARRFG
jgi:hypothetical protein